NFLRSNFLSSEMMNTKFRKLISYTDVSYKFLRFDDSVSRNLHDVPILARRYRSSQIFSIPNIISFEIGVDKYFTVSVKNLNRRIGCNFYSSDFPSIIFTITIGRNKIWNR